PTSWYELPRWEAARAFGCGGFFLQGDITTSNNIICLDTDDSWRFQNAAAWERETPGCSLGFVEKYDARRSTNGWADVNFDDDTWGAVEILRVPGRNFAGDVTPFPVLVTRDIPPLFEEMRRPAALLRWGEVVNAPAHGSVGEQMAQETLGDLARCQVDNLTGLTTDTGPAEIVTTDDHSVSFVLDFGSVVFGRVGLDLDGPAGGMVDFVYGEQLQPDGRVLVNMGILGYDNVPQAHRYILREGAQTWEQFEPAGFRYLQVTVRHCPRPLHLLGLTVNSTGYPVEARGRFACSDDQLTRMWQIGADTLGLCMHDAYVDCPTREQRQWVGDAYVQILVNFAAFGDPHLAARLLRQTAESQQPDGLTMPSVVSDFAVKDFFNIPDFCLYWILALDRTVLFTGDTALAEELHPAIVKAVAWFERHLDADNLLAQVPHWVFVDWADVDKQGQVTALNAQFVAALRAASRLAHAAGQPGQADRFAALADQVADAINRLLWDEERGVYVDARHRGVQSRRISQQANAAVFAWDIAPIQRWPAVFATVMDDAHLVLTRTGDGDPTSPTFDEENQVVMAQPFFCHHLHRALSRAGEQEAMLDNLRRRWGPWVAAGEPTFWELWQLGPATSTCHAWAATPTFDLSTEVLGIAPLTPGFARFRVAPHPADLAWADGVFPSPLGDIAVAWRQTTSHFDLLVTVPDGAEADVILPTGSWGRVELDDRVVTEAQALIVGPGSHRIVAFVEENTNE
ncbi:MAG: family 78 glycoside hydrolase catalytic domain, partial [Caldilineaceae bacterium]|nr:family 78 glycoside hydrolase catalytic domain [Caldilineaceae bacterium]